MIWFKKILKVLNILLDVCSYLCLLALLWIVFQMFCFSSFRIPTNSMEPSLIPGDMILVNKLVGGARLFDLFAALRKEPVNIHRVPGYGSFKRNDVLVFNFPYSAGWDRIDFDVMKFYVKRCIALPGDTLAIRNGFFHVHGVNEELGNVELQSYISHLTDTTSNFIVTALSYPQDKELGWTIKEFGPFHVPAKGQRVEMNRTNWLLYRRLIHWEQKEQPLLKENGRVYLRDSLITAYCFEQNYYFMAGDKLTDSQDSRYWGLLPEEFIAGRADYIWLSKERYTKEIRWDRFMKKIR
ncbi:MAG: signal peptidase I [Mediterranea sp.]|jgi:signal peptidase I|nr:signal peptidase I [Mediterranea sp.]